MSIRRVGPGRPAVSAILDAVLIIAHRGASQAAPENTVEAFRLADEMGADGVELDVRLAPGGRLVVAHDPLPDDRTAVDGLPDLATVLDACGQRMLVNVEIKNEPVAGSPPDRMEFDLAVVAPTIEALHASPVELPRLLISSFSWPTIDACRQLDPSIATAALCRDVDDRSVDRLARRGHLAVHPYEPLVTPGAVQRCHDAGLLVTTWTCNDPARLRELAAMGVDGVCTDVPDTALAALGRSDARVTPRWERAS